MPKICVVPHARMKIAKAQNTQPNSTSDRFVTNSARTNGIEKYATAISASEVTWSQTSSGRQSRQIPCGARFALSNKAWRLPSIDPPAERQDSRSGFTPTSELQTHKECCKTHKECCSDSKKPL